ncbi:DHH family phosphoesterase [Lachnospiraceae bacterium OttesenSCG-928-E19]|nr:DHH family phosphoesterase [Lachnospiraceae bacterium OttesenSCG-928-E19]
MKNYVTSYVNPDLDGIACSIALAKLLGWTPVYFGGIDCESEFVLNLLNIDVPVHVTDISDADHVALVDTHHVMQLDPSVPLDRVTLIYDHHPNGNDDKFPNAQITNETIGAAASLIAKRYLDEGINDEKMLRLLGYAIASNTVDFTTVNATDFDRKIFAQITKLYPISHDEIWAMLRSRANIMKRGLRPVIESDIKIFDTAYGRIGISQIGVPGLNDIIDIDAIKPILHDVANDLGLKYFLMNGGDAGANTSIVISANNETTELLRKHFRKPFENNVEKFDRMLLRKKDFIFPDK